MAQPEYNNYSASFIEQQNSPTIRIDADGVTTVTRVNRAPSDQVLNGMTLYEAGDKDLDTSAFFTDSTVVDDGAGYCTVTSNFQIGPAPFQEKANSPQISEAEDGLVRLVSTWVGLSGITLTNFLNDKQRGDTYGGNYPNVFLRSKSAVTRNDGLAEVTLIYEGVLGDGDVSNTPSDIIVATSYTRETVSFSPWSSGGFARGPQVVGTYYSETATTSFITSNPPNVPGASGLSTNGNNTFIFEWSPAAFDPSSHPHDLQKRKIATNFSKRNIAGSNLHSVTWTYQWLITDGETNFSAGGSGGSS